MLISINKVSKLIGKDYRTTIKLVEKFGFTFNGTKDLPIDKTTEFLKWLGYGEITINKYLKELVG